MAISPSHTRREMLVGYCSRSCFQVLSLAGHNLQREAGSNKYPTAFPLLFSVCVFVRFDIVQLSGHF